MVYVLTLELQSDGNREHSEMLKQASFSLNQSLESGTRLFIDAYL